MANPQPVKGPPALPRRASSTGALPPMLPQNMPKDPSKFDLTGGVQRASTRSVNRQSGKTEGVWFAFDSTNVNKAKVDAQYDIDGKKTGVGTITIEFVSGATYEYADRPMSDWFYLITSSSKGRKAYYDIRGPGRSRKGMGIWKPCIQTVQAWRSKSEIRAIKAAREPVKAKHKLRTYTRGGKMNAFGKGGKRIRVPTVH
jgi:hypothetical protein